MVSVVIPAYNMAKFVKAAITSVLDGSYDDVEVICVDDGSTDHTAAVIRQFTDPASDAFDRRVRYLSQPNQGKPAAVNRGIDAMQGQYFALLDADDRLPPHGLDVRVAALESTPNADMAIGGFAVIDEAGTSTLGHRPCPDTRDTEYLRRAFYLSYKTPFHLNACMLDRALIQKVGPFDPWLDRCQDGDYAIRSMELAQRVTTVDDSVYLYRKHRATMQQRISTRLATARHRPYVMYKNFPSPQRYFYMLFVAILDAGKLAYELFSNYGQ
jgi:glycosyltransferase involved in cell wall biosynthesis